MTAYTDRIIDFWDDVLCAWSGWLTMWRSEPRECDCKPELRLPPVDRWHNRSGGEELTEFEELAYRFWH